MPDRNVLGGPLEPCGNDTITGFYRDGCGASAVLVTTHERTLEVVADGAARTRRRRAKQPRRPLTIPRLLAWTTQRASTERPPINPRKSPISRRCGGGV